MRMSRYLPSSGLIKIKTFRYFLIGFVLALGVSNALWAQAAITSITGITLTPSNPSPGQTVTVNWSYTEASAFNNPRFFIVVSNTSTLQNAGSAGESIVFGDGCVPSALVNGGCNSIGTNVPAGSNTYSASIVIPSNLTPGTWYVIVAMRDYYVGLNPNPTIDQQNFTSFTVPLPAASFTITKSAEGTTASPQGLILFNLDYSFVNTTNFIISDNIPTNTTFVTASPGGGVSGSSVTWNLGNATTQQSGTVWFLAQVNAGTADGTTITNTASGQTNEVASTSSNAVSVVVGSPAVTLTKSQSSSSLAAGSNVTYTLAWSASGQNLDLYDSYNNDSNGTSGNSILGYDNSTPYAQVGAGIFQVTSDVNNNHYITSNPGGSGNFPLLLRTAPTFDICGGVVVEGDLLIPGGSPGGADATMVLAYNVNGGVTQAYMLAMSLDNGPGNFFLQKNNGASVTYPVAMPNSAVSLTIATDTWFTVKGQITYSAGNLTIQGKIWQKGTAEPAGWAFTYVDPSPFPCGETWQQGWQSDGTAYSPSGDSFANLKVFGPGPVVNSTVSDVVPPGITYLGSNSVTATSAPNLSWSFPGTLFAQTAPVSWWGQVACPGPMINQFSLTASNMAATATSNPVTLSISGSCITSTPTDTPTITPTSTPTSTGTPPPTFTPTSTPSLTPTPTATATSTITPTPPPTATFTSTPVGLHVWPNPFDTHYAVAVGPQNLPALQAYQVPLGAKMTIYTVSGELVNTLAALPTGYIYWYGTNSGGAPVAAGIYYYVIQDGSNTLLTGKVLLLRD